MNAVTKEDFRSLVYLVSLGVVGAATVGVFFGVGLMWLIDPHPAALSLHPVMSAQALEPEEGDTGTVWGSTSDSRTEKVAATPTPDTTTATSTPGATEATDAIGHRAALAWRSAAIETPIIPAAIHHAKKARVSQHQHHPTSRYFAALWRPDASAGPNPGGGFYGPPNSNVGYINPR
jgi:hypothetical protein